MAEYFFTIQPHRLGTCFTVMGKPCACIYPTMYVMQVRRRLATCEDAKTCLGQSLVTIGFPPTVEVRGRLIVIFVFVIKVASPTSELTQGLFFYKAGLFFHLILRSRSFVLVIPVIRTPLAASPAPPPEIVPPHHRPHCCRLLEHPSDYVESAYCTHQRLINSLEQHV